MKKGYEISDAESFAVARELLRKEGILAGSSSGTLLAAALRYCREQTEPKRVVSLVPDSGNKYLSKMFNDYWMADQGFLEHEHRGDLRDLITRRFDEGGTVVLGPDDTLNTAYSRMKLYDVSQLPVIEGDRVIGILDESDLLMAVLGDRERFNEPVRKAMSQGIETIPVRASLSDLLPVFNKGYVAVVVDGPHFLGIITGWMSSTTFA